MKFPALKNSQARGSQAPEEGNALDEHKLTGTKFHLLIGIYLILLIALLLLLMLL